MTMKENHTFQVDAGLKTTTVAGADADLRYHYVSPGKRSVRFGQTVINAGAATDTGTITTKIQQSPTTVDSDFADVTDGGFTAVTDTDNATGVAFESIFVALDPSNGLYVRPYYTVAGLPNFAVSVTCEVAKRSA